MYFKNSIYLLLLLSGLLIVVGQKSGIIFPYFFQNYWNDFVIIPLVSKAVLLILQSIHGKHFVLRPVYILCICLYFSILFEIIFPKFYIRYTSDYMDVMMYFLGGILFYLLEYDTYKV